nr:unnamed protein product [Callosobruchus analis]
MDKKMEQLQRYALSVENELELLIFSMFDLIDSKVRTLRKLMKFHMHIKRVSTLSSLKKMGLSRSKFKNAALPSYTHSYTESEEMYSLLPNKGSFDASEIRTSEIRDSSSEDNAEDVQQPLIKDSLPTVEITDDSVNQTELPPQKTQNQNSAPIVTVSNEQGVRKEKSEGCEEKSNEESKVTPEVESKDSSTNAIAKDIDNGNGDSSVLLTHEDKCTSLMAKTDTVDTTTDDERNDTDNSACDDTTTNSAAQAYVVVSTLEGALNSLHDCTPGDSGVFVDGNTFKHVVDILQTVLNTCCQKKRWRCPSLERKNKIEKSCTQPALKVGGGEIPLRLTSSVSNCNKCANKK